MLDQSGVDRLQLLVLGEFVAFLGLHGFSSMNPAHTSPAFKIKLDQMAYGYGGKLKPLM
jgi:hypothetical protein